MCLRTQARAVPNRSFGRNVLRADYTEVHLNDGQSFFCTECATNGPHGICNRWTAGNVRRKDCMECVTDGLHGKSRRTDCTE